MYVHDHIGSVVNHMIMISQAIQSFTYFTRSSYIVGTISFGVVHNIGVEHKHRIMCPTNV